MELTVQKREKFGKAVKTLRREGFVPAELYGHGVENLHLTVAAKDFALIFRKAGESGIVNIVLGAEKMPVKIPVLIHEVSRDPVTDAVIAVDFYQVRMDERIKIKIPVHFTGEAPAVKEKNGLLVKSMHEIEIEAMPAAIPSAISVDLSHLKEIGQSIYVRDMVFPQEVKTYVNPETVVATITVKSTEEEETAAAAPASVESIKVETEEKKAERQAKKEVSTPTEAAEGSQK